MTLHRGDNVISTDVCHGFECLRSLPAISSGDVVALKAACA